MSPVDIKSHDIHLTLRYISPPSQLVEPLPPHMLSKPLLQRHHFLRPSPEDPQAYLCWPSNEPTDSAQAIEALEELSSAADIHEHTSYPTQYVADDEDSYAHVAVTAKLRLVLHWDEGGGWKYHNCGLMPFPPQSFPTLDAALKSVIPSSAAISSYPPESSYQGDLSDEDSYWDSYGATDDAEEGERASMEPSESLDNSEDAYWALYGKVQGSADSTIPSPRLPENAKNKPLAQYQSQEPQSALFQREQIITYDYKTLHPPSQPSRLDPPSPRALSFELQNISPRPDFFAAEIEESGSGSDTLSPEPAADGIEWVHDDVKVGETLTDPVAFNEDEHIKTCIAGIYGLWKSTRRPGKEGPDEFLQFVAATIERT